MRTRLFDSTMDDRTNCSFHNENNHSIRLKNIEETEKAKRAVADARRERRHNNDEEHLVATRCKFPFLLRSSLIYCIYE